MFSSLLKAVLVILLSFSGFYAVANTGSQEALMTAIIAKVALSPELASYKSARGLEGSESKLPLVEIALERVDADQDFYQGEGINYEVIFVYQVNDKALCRISMPVGVEGGELSKIGAGSSDGGCGE